MVFLQRHLFKDVFLFPFSADAQETCWQLKPRNASIVFYLINLIVVKQRLYFLFKLSIFKHKSMTHQDVIQPTTSNSAIKSRNYVFYIFTT